MPKGHPISVPRTWPGHRDYEPTPNAISEGLEALEWARRDPEGFADAVLASGSPITNICSGSDGCDSCLDPARCRVLRARAGLRP